MPAKLQGATGLSPWFQPTRNSPACSRWAGFRVHGQRPPQEPVLELLHVPRGPRSRTPKPQEWLKEQETKYASTHRQKYFTPRSFALCRGSDVNPGVKIQTGATRLM